MTPDNSPAFQRCILPSVPQDLQHTVNVVTNFVLVPLNVLLSALSFAFNLVVLIAVIRTRSTQRRGSLLLCSLSISNITWAMYSIVVDIARIADEDLCPEEIAAFAQVASAFCYTSTLGNLVVISRDRHLAIGNPLWYHNHLTRSLVIKQLSAVWVFSVTMSIFLSITRLSPILRLPYTTILVLFYFTSISTIVYSYAGILLASKRHRRVMGQHNGQMLTTLRREKKLDNTVGVILLLLCFTFLPALISPLILKVLGFSKLDFIPFRPFYSWLITLNGFLNPLLNYLRNQDVCRAVRSLFQCNRCTGIVHIATNQPRERGPNIPRSTRVNKP